MRHLPLRHLPLPAAVLLGLLVTGCSGDGAGTAAPAPATGPTVPATAAPTAAPTAAGTPDQAVCRESGEASTQAGRTLGALSRGGATREEADAALAAAITQLQGDATRAQAPELRAGAMEAATALQALQGALGGSDRAALGAAAQAAAPALQSFAAVCGPFLAAPSG